MVCGVLNDKLGAEEDEEDEEDFLIFFLIHEFQ